MRERAIIFLQLVSARASLVRGNLNKYLTEVREWATRCPGKSIPGSENGQCKGPGVRGTAGRRVWLQESARGRNTNELPRSQPCGPGQGLGLWFQARWGASPQDVLLDGIRSYKKNFTGLMFSTIRRDATPLCWRTTRSPLREHAGPFLTLCA